jgi:RecA/RadA recombinase
MKAQEQALVGNSLADLKDIFAKAIPQAEKASGLSSVLLNRDSFANRATSTGSLWLDYIMGGGIPPARIIGIAGPEHSGKSVLVTNILFNQCKNGGFSFFMDAEGSTDPLFLEARGLNFDIFLAKRNKKGEVVKGDVDQYHLYQPRTGEEMAEHLHKIMGQLPENRTPDKPIAIFALDSVVALITDALADDLDSNKMAMHARMYASIMPVINGLLARTGCSFIYTNQLRQKPGVTFGGDGTYEPAGDALKFFSSVRLMLKRTQPKLWGDKHPFIVDEYNPGVKPKAGGVWIEPHYDSDGRVVGEDKYIYSSIATVKNKAFKPHQSCWIKIQFEKNGTTGHGIDPVFDIFSFLASVGLIKKAEPKGGEGEKKKDLKGLFETVTWKSYDLAKLGFPDRFTYPQLKVFILNNPGLSDKLREQLLLTNIAFTPEAPTSKAIAAESEEES